MLRGLQITSANAGFPRLALQRLSWLLVVSFRGRHRAIQKHGKTILLIKLICCELSFITVIQWIPQDLLLLLLLLLFANQPPKNPHPAELKQKTRLESLSLISESEKNFRDTNREGPQEGPCLKKMIIP